jgi:NAD(P)-dependent dehydrogenase (short-subunit alcohol dehydrogenase family)
MGRLAGKRALMTGAGGKLGADLARAFAAEGADLVLTTRTAAKLDPLAADVRALGVRAATIAADFTCDEDIDRLADAAWDAFGGIDIVLLSSQPGEPAMGDLLSTPDDVWREQQQAVAWGPFRLLRALAPRMMEAGGGSIVTVISSTGIDPIPGYGAYGLAKGTLWLLTRYMAAEWGQGGIRANAICPGMIATGGSGAASEDAPPAAMLARTALGRLGRNSEVVGAALHLAGDESSFTTGQCIHVNGGRF